MADTTGTIRYAGPATGFVAPMVLHKLMGGTSDESVIPEEIKETPVNAADSNSVAAPAPAETKPAPVVQNPAPQPVQEARQPENQYKELSEEDAIQAERKLAYARDLFMKLGRKPGLNYTRGVALCREIIRDYPGSEYAQQARELLREIPENQRARYKITDEELGL